MNYISLKYSESILAFQLQFGTYKAESEHVRWEKEKRHFNEVAFFTRYSLVFTRYSFTRYSLVFTHYSLALLLVPRCFFTRYSLRFYSLLVAFLLITRCAFTCYSLCF